MFHLVNLGMCFGWLGYVRMIIKDDLGLQSLVIQWSKYRISLGFLF